MANDDVKVLLEFRLQAMLASERRMVEVLAEAMEDVEDAEVRRVLDHHREETERQVERLERAFATFGKEPRPMDASVLEGVVEERRRFLSEDPSPQLLQTFLLGAAAKVEHMEIAAYEEIVALADVVGANEVLEAAEENLAEERAALEKVNGLRGKVTSAAVEAEVRA